MRLLGFDISVRIKIKKNGTKSPYRIENELQNMVLGSHSQYFEDIFIDSIFRGKTSGTYVDIGANHPSELNNTKRFYDRGWRGVNVEPDVTMYKKLCEARPADINLNMGIGKNDENLIFYELSPNTLSTFDKSAALRSIQKGEAKLVSHSPIKVISLLKLFNTSLNGRQIDFLSVDAEGYEYEILSSNNWDIYRPVALIVEVNQDKDNKVYNLMISCGYLLIYFNGTNGIFVDGCSSNIIPHIGKTVQHSLPS